MRPGALDYKPRVQVAARKTLRREAVSCVLYRMQVIPFADERAIALRLRAGEHAFRTVGVMRIIVILMQGQNFPRSIDHRSLL